MRCRVSETRGAVMGHDVVAQRQSRADLAPWEAVGLGYAQEVRESETTILLIYEREEDVRASTL